MIQGCTFQRIRVVVSTGRRWWIDPDLALFARDWRIWVYGARPLARLQWDPGEWVWLDSRTGPLQFFQYSVRFGRHLLWSRRPVVAAAARHWRSQRLSQGFLRDFWQRL